jgi:hypothetical protein
MKSKDIEVFEDVTVECADEDFVIITSLTGRNLSSISLWTAEECNALIGALAVARDWLIELENESALDTQDTDTPPPPDASA